MGGVFSAKAVEVDLGLQEMALSKAKEIVSSNHVVVFSKTYCVYCARVKQLLSKLGASYKVIELDVESDGSEMQSALLEWTGQRTVPNVFIAGNHMGGCDANASTPSSASRDALLGKAIMAKQNEGKLVPLLTEAGALA